MERNTFFSDFILILRWKTHLDVCRCKRWFCRKAVKCRLVLNILCTTSLVWHNIHHQQQHVPCLMCFIQWPHVALSFWDVKEPKIPVAHVITSRYQTQRHRIDSSLWRETAGCCSLSNYVLYFNRLTRNSDFLSLEKALYEYSNNI